MSKTAIKKFQDQFSIDAVGEISGEQFKGTFTVLTRFSHAQRLGMDIHRRQLLGPQPEGAIASQRALQTADMTSQLAGRIIESPSWWTNDGLDLVDDEVILAVYNAAIEAEGKARKAVIDAAEKAKKDLSEGAPETE